MYLVLLCTLRNAAAVLGTLYVLRVILRFLWGLGGGLCAYVLAPLGISRINLRKYGPWAGMPAHAPVYRTTQPTSLASTPLPPSGLSEDSAIQS